MFRQNYNKKTNIELDEILIDTKNIPGYNRENLEGIIERPINERTFMIIGLIFLALGIFFGIRMGYLQIYKGEAFRERADKNYLRATLINPPRGIIYDRFGNIIAGNDLIQDKWVRTYPTDGFLHVVGFLDKTGIEASYNELLRGIQGEQLDEINAKGDVISSGINQISASGKNIITSLSKDLQIKLTNTLNETMDARGFQGGAGVIIDVNTGEILALASVPEFDPNILVGSSSPKRINALLNDPKKPFFNRAIYGLYPPGSIVKPALAAGALNENTISPEKQIFSSGSISLPNPYFPDQPSVFKDWRAQGWVDMRKAIAVSSDVYFYTIGGGFGDQKGLGILNINKYFSLFGFDQKTGIDLLGEKNGSLPNPDLKKNGRDWSIGDTYHTAIGQGDVLVTPIEIAIYAATLASKGTIPYPHIVTAIQDQNTEKIEKLAYSPKATNILPKEIFDVIHDGMRGSALFGTASALGTLPIPIAAKTGTAEIGKTGKVDSWSIGFFPYEKPRLAFAILMEGGPVTNLVGGTYVASQVIRWISDTDFLSKIDNGILKDTN